MTYEHCTLTFTTKKSMNFEILGPGTVSLSSVSVYSLSTAPSKAKATNLYGQPPSLSNLTTAPAPSLRRTQSKSNHPPISYSPFVMMKKSDQEEDQEFSSPSPLTFDETVTIDCDRNSNSALSEATYVSSFHGKTKSKAFNFIGLFLLFLLLSRFLLIL